MACLILAWEPGHPDILRILSSSCGKGALAYGGLKLSKQWGQAHPVEPSVIIGKKLE